MINLRKVGMLGIASCALLLAGCNKKPADTKMVYADAKKWAIEKYKDNSKTPILPKSVESKWGCHTYITKYQDDEKSGTAGKTKQNVKSKMKSLFTGLGYCTDDVAEKTVVSSESLVVDELAFYTTDTIKVEQNEGKTIFTNDNYFNVLNGENFDEIMNYFYQGFSKNMCDYTVNDADKTLQVDGSLTVANEVFNPGGTKTTAISLMRMPCCSVRFNSNGTVQSIKFNFNYDANVIYVWYNETISSWSNYFEFAISAGSYIEFNYNY